MPKGKVLLVVAHEGYQPIEYGEPKKILEDAGYTVITASNKPGVAIAKDGSTTPVDIVVENVKVPDYAGIFFIGGPGALENLDNEASYTIIKVAKKAGMPLGAICISTRILAKANALDRVQATGWDGDNELAGVFDAFNVSYIQAPVVVDQGIVTATGPNAAKEFGKAIISLLKGGDWEKKV